MDNLNNYISESAINKEYMTYTKNFFKEVEPTQVICHNCGKCCTDILMTMNSFEIDKIKKYIKKHNIKPVNRNTIFDKEQKNICPFLNYENLCNIYPVRLEICDYFYCENFKKNKNIPSYKNANVVSMMQTFFPNEFMTDHPFDLSLIKNNISEYKKKIYG